jgi:hypothetical protein
MVRSCIRSIAKSSFCSVIAIDGALELALERTELVVYGFLFANIAAIVC